METVIIYPNSLFEDNHLINSKSTVYLVEDPVYFTDYNYHKIKLILHRASMKYYQDYLRKKYKCTVKYIDFKTQLNNSLKKHKGNIVSLYDPVDHNVTDNLRSLCKKHKIELVIYDTPLFMTGIDDLEEYNENTNTFIHGNFYKFQRKNHDILLTKTGKPHGGSWSYDIKNREPFPKNFKNNYIPRNESNKYIKEATSYVNKYFKDNPGDTNLYVPIDHKGAKAHFRKFLKERFKCFGPYQDAQNKDIPFGCHSIISPMLNIGLLTPDYIIYESEEYGKKNRVPLASVEGFIRQVIGWREAVRFFYLFKYKEMKGSNHFNHRRKLDNDIWYYRCRKIA